MERSHGPMDSDRGVGAWKSLISAVGKKTWYRVRSGMVSKKRARFEKTVEESGLRSGRNRSLSRASSKRLRVSQTHICKARKIVVGAVRLCPVEAACDMIRLVCLRSSK
jgi:hypothetical protein